MRYVLQFVDKTFRIVSDQAGQGALLSLAAGKPVVIGKSGYQPHYISAIKPLPQWASEMEAYALSAGKRFCRFGVLHAPEDRCSCSRFKEILWERGEFDELPAAERPSLISEPAPEEKAQELLPPVQGDQYTAARDKFISSHSAK